MITLQTSRQFTYGNRIFHIILPLEQRVISSILQTFLFAKGQKYVYVHSQIPSPFPSPSCLDDVSRFVKFVYYWVGGEGGTFSIVLWKLVVAQEVLKKFSKVWAKAQQYDLRGVLVIISWRCDRSEEWSSHCLPGKWRSMEQIKFCEGANWTGDVAIEIFRFSPGNSRFFFLLTEFTEVFLIYFAVLFLDFQIFFYFQGDFIPPLL